MVLSDLTTSTGKVGSSFSGVLPNDSTPQWNHDESIEISNQTRGLILPMLSSHLLSSRNHTYDIAKSQMTKKPVVELELETFLEELLTFLRRNEAEEDDDDLLIDERIETKPNAVYKAKIRIRGFRRGKPSSFIADELEVDLFDTE